MPTDSPMASMTAGLRLKPFQVTLPRQSIIDVVDQRGAIIDRHTGERRDDTSLVYAANAGDALATMNASRGSSFAMKHTGVKVVAITS